MKSKISQLILAVAVGFLFSSSVAKLEVLSTSKLFANYDDNQHIQTVDRLNIDPDYPPPPPPPPPPGGGLTE